MIRVLTKADLDAAAIVHAEAFSTQKRSKEWLACALASYPRSLCYVLEQADEVCAYIIWTQKSGFRAEVILDLEQLAVLPRCHNQGLGQTLIKASLEQVKAKIAERGAIVKHILVSTGASNHAQKLYRKVLGVEIEATLSGLYSEDEVIMVAKNIDK